MSARRARPYRLHDATYLLTLADKSWSKTWASATPTVLRDMLFPYVMGKKVPIKVARQMAELVREDQYGQWSGIPGQPKAWASWARQIISYSIGGTPREDLVSKLNREDVISLVSHECNEEIGIRARETSFEGAPFFSNFGIQDISWTNRETGIKVVRRLGLWMCAELVRYGYLGADCPEMVFSYQTQEECETSKDMDEPSRFMSMAANSFRSDASGTRPTFSWRTINLMVNAYWFIHKDKNRMGDLLAVTAGICDQMGLPV